MVLDIIPPVDNFAKIFNPDGSLLIETNNLLLFSHIRVQIKENELEGYSVQYQDEIIPIDKNGRLPSWPDGFFDTWDNLLTRLL